MTRSRFRFRDPPARFAALVAVAVAAAANGQSLRREALSPGTAQAVFEDARRLSHADGGALWGKKLYGPIMLVDPATRTVVTNWRDKEGLLSRSGRVFTGTLPVSVGISNTVVDVGGVTWSMVMWPLPSDDAPRRALVMHECFHRVQMDLGLPPYSPPNAHLDTSDGRRWMRLELRALAAAVESDDADARRAAAGDALVFRAMRRSLFEGAADEERKLELNEGLAEYTGIRLGAESDEERLGLTLRTLRLTERAGSLIRNFAYPTGAAYGLLLDRLADDWRRGVTKDVDLGDLLAARLALAYPRPLDEAARERAEAYGGAALFEEEDARGERQAGVTERDRARFVDGPVLVIDLDGLRYNFGQNGMRSLDGEGTIYETISVSGPWGVLSVTGGALMTDLERVRRTLRVAFPDGTATSGRIAGDGWTLALDPAWRVVEAGRAGTFEVKRQPRYLDDANAGSLRRSDASAMEFILRHGAHPQFPS